MSSLIDFLNLSSAHLHRFSKFLFWLLKSTFRNCFSEFLDWPFWFFWSNFLNFFYEFFDLLFKTFLLYKKLGNFFDRLFETAFLSFLIDVLVFCSWFFWLTFGNFFFEFFDRKLFYCVSSDFFDQFFETSFLTLIDLFFLCNFIDISKLLIFHNSLIDYSKFSLWVRWSTF